MNDREYEWDMLRESFFPGDAGVPSLFEQALVTARMHGLPYRQWEHGLGINTEKLDNVNVYYYPAVNSARSGRLRGKFDGREKKKVYLSRTTLVVVPDNLMDQWALEIYKVNRASRFVAGIHKMIEIQHSIGLKKKASLNYVLALRNG